MAIEIKVPFKVKWADNYNDPSLVMFQVMDLKIYSSDKYPDLHFEIDNDSISLKHLLGLL